MSGFRGAVAAIVAALLAVPSCGVFLSGDCAERSACADAGEDEGSAADVAAPDGGGDSPGDDGATDGGPTRLCVPTGPEDCSNGIDDDCNGMTDCADPSCSGAGYTCAPAVPDGWVGPTALYEAKATAPACPPGYAVAVTSKGGLSAPAAQCGCTCTPSAQQCAPPAGHFYADGNCNASCTGMISMPSATCTPSASPCAGASVWFNAAAPSWSGRCDRHPTTTVATPIFDTSARVCAWSAAPDIPGGCAGTGNQCVRSPAAPYGTRLCIYQVGDPAPSACPPGPYTNYHVYYANVDDTRDCTTCNCGPPTGGACTGSIGFYQGTRTCSGAPVATYSFAGNCLNLTQPITAEGLYVPSMGTCGAPSGGQPTGAALGTGATTVCCL